jgi:hypothetical protein
MARHSSLSQVSYKIFSNSLCSGELIILNAAKSQRATREAKHTSWKAFVSSLSRSTRSDVVWNKLRRMSGKYSRKPIPGTCVVGAVITSQVGLANTVASFWYRFALPTAVSLVLELLKTAHNFTSRATPSVWTNSQHYTAARNTFPGPDCR